MCQPTITPIQLTAYQVECPLCGGDLGAPNGTCTWLAHELERMGRAGFQAKCEGCGARVRLPEVTHADAVELARTT